METVRKSNIELLRIILMIFVLLHHFLVWGAFPCMIDSSLPLSLEAIPAIYLNGFLFMAVNCFILISGYFGIKFDFRKLLSFYLICAFYAFLSQIVGIVAFNNEYSIKRLVFNSVCCISQTQLWYVKGYFALLCLTPILNPARETLTRKQYLMALILMALLSFYFGYWKQSQIFDLNGYSIYQFVFLYFVGGYIKKYVNLDVVKKYRIVWLLSYVVFSLLWGFLSISDRKGAGLVHWFPFSYNNPILVFSATSFFLFFLSFTFKSKLVNYMASGAVAVYLATENEFVRTGLYSFVTEISSSSIMMLSAIAIVLALVIMLFDRFRALVTKPILGLYDKYIGK